MRERFASASEIRTEKRLYTQWVYPFPVSDVVDFFARHFGPIVRANKALPEEDRASLRRDLIDVFTRFDRGTNGSTFLEGELLSVHVVR